MTTRPFDFSASRWSLYLAITSAVMLLIGFGNGFPEFFNSGGIFIIFLIALLSIIFSFNGKMAHRICSRCVAGFVMVCVVSVLAKNVALRGMVNEEVSRQQKRIETQKRQRSIEAGW